MKKIILLPCFFTAFTSFAQTKLTIQSSNEICSNVSSAVPKSPPTDNGFTAGRQTENHTIATIRSFLQFDLSTIPQGSFVNWAHLSLFSTGRNGGANSSVLRRITSSWNPATINWGNQPVTTKRGQVHLPMSTSPTENYKNINVTNLLQQMLDSPETSFGFEIKLDSEDRTYWRQVQFKAHSNSTFSLNFPKLVFEYTPPGSQPAVTSISVDDRSSAEMTIYPNPCDKVFNCNIKSANPENMTLRVMDMLGRTLYSQSLNASNLQMRINLPTSSTGIYFVVLQNSKNETIVSQELQVN